MSTDLSENTQAILLLSAPLMLGKQRVQSDLLKPHEYQAFARHLLDIGRQPADLLARDAEEVIGSSRHMVDEHRLRDLLARGLLLSQAVERWQSRAIWVVSRADAAYPRRLKRAMNGQAPAILYGCGDPRILGRGGLAVVGSRRVNGDLIKYSSQVGSLAAAAGETLISGGARGVDRAAMDGALEAGGLVVGVLAEELEREAMNRRNRDPIRSQKLALITQYDPCLHFSVGHAMQRNKLIYALADNALVVNSDFEKGGTWAGAVEQLERFRFAPVFVRSTGESSRGLQALRERGALPWPGPVTPDLLRVELSRAVTDDQAKPHRRSPTQQTLLGREDLASSPRAEPTEPGSPADELFAKVQRLLLRVLQRPQSEADVAQQLAITKKQASTWLSLLVKQGVLQRTERPVRYSIRVPSDESGTPRR